VGVAAARDLKRSSVGVDVQVLGTDIAIIDSGLGACADHGGGRVASPGRARLRASTIPAVTLTAGICLGGSLRTTQ
jgi:hypothetical protein